MEGLFRKKFRSRVHALDNTWAIRSGIGLNRKVYASEGEALVGTVSSGDVTTTGSCNSTSWDVAEAAGGVDVQFSFYVADNKSKKIKIKAKTDTKKTYTVKMYDGTSWVDVTTVEIDTTFQSYTVNISSAYTYQGRILLRVVYGTNDSETLYIDCAYLLATADGVPPTAPGNLYGLAWDLPSTSQAPTSASNRELYVYWANSPYIVFQTNRQFNATAQTPTPLTLSAGYASCNDGSFTIDDHTTVPSAQWMVGSTYDSWRFVFSKTSAQNYAMHIVLNNMRAWLSNDSGVTGQWYYAYIKTVLSADSGVTVDLDKQEIDFLYSGTGSTNRELYFELTAGARYP